MLTIYPFPKFTSCVLVISDYVYSLNFEKF